MTTTTAHEPLALSRELARECAAVIVPFIDIRLRPLVEALHKSRIALCQVEQHLRLTRSSDVAILAQQAVWRIDAALARAELVEVKGAGGE